MLVKKTTPTKTIKVTEATHRLVCTVGRKLGCRTIADTVALLAEYAIKVKGK
jgi:hypothetical protein